MDDAEALSIARTIQRSMSRYEERYRRYVCPHGMKGPHYLDSAVGGADIRCEGVYSSHAVLEG